MSYFATNVQTPLTPQQVAAEINKISKPATLLDSFILRDMKTYQFTGSASVSHFKVMRNIGNPFPAVLLGSVRPSDSGSSIHIRVRPHLASCVILVLALSFLYLVTRSDYSGPPFWAFAVSSIAVFLIPYFLGASSSLEGLKKALKAST